MSLFKDEFLKEIKKLSPSVTQNNLTPYRSGIRAQMVDREGHLLDDIVVEYHEKSTHVLNAVSPGMTASFAFAEHLVNEIQNHKRVV